MRDSDPPGRSIQRPTNVRQLIFALACGTSLLLYLHRYTWVFVKRDVREEFGWDNTTLGWLDGLFGLSYGVAQVPAGALCDWFGAHVLLGSSILLWSLALFGTTLATGLASMAVARLIFGIGQAGCYPMLNKASKNWFPLTWRTTAQGWIATFFGRAGGALSFVVFGTVMLGWLHIPWRWAIGMFTGLGVLCGLLFVFLFRNTPREHPWANEAEARLIQADDADAACATGSTLNWGHMLRRSSVWFLFLRGALSNMADVVWVYWVPLYLTDVKELARSDSGWIAALPLIGGALGGVASGSLQTRLIARTGRRRFARRSIGMTGKWLAAVMMVATLGLESAWVLAGGFMLVKFFTDWEQPAEWGTISDIAGRNAATVFACVNTIGAVAGFVAGPLVGIVLGHFGGNPAKITAPGWQALSLLVALVYLLAGSAWLFIDPEKPID
jgi:MFS family permease